MTRKKIIKVKKGVVEQLMAAHGCSQTTIWNALAYRTFSNQAEIIREQALNIYGGVKTTKVIL